MRRTHPRTGFTIVELLVVVAIIVVLLALLAPALDKAINMAEITRCAAQQHALTQIFATYAAEQKRLFPSGKSESTGESTMLVSYKFVDLIMQYSSKTRGIGANERWGVVPQLLIDPSYGDFGWKSESLGYYIGYNYLGGHPQITRANEPKWHPDGAGWESPMGLNRIGSGQLMACHLSFFVDGGSSWAFVAHSKAGGPLGSNQNWQGYHFVSTDFEDIVQLGGGNNVGRVDGSVFWRDVAELHLWWSSAGTDGEPDVEYPAYW